MSYEKKRRQRFTYFVVIDTWIDLKLKDEWDIGSVNWPL